MERERGEWERGVKKRERRGGGGGEGMGDSKIHCKQHLHQLQEPNCRKAEQMCVYVCSCV